MPPPERWTDTRRIPPPLAAPPPPPPPASGARPCPDADRRREWAAAYRADPPEPATDPPTSAHEPPAALDASPDTPEAPGGAQGLILGRALLDRDGEVWSMTERVLAEDYGPVREVLLVHPAAGPVLEAAVALVASWGHTETAEEATLAAAVDALPTANLATASRGLADDPEPTCVQTTDNDMQAFVELPDCQACGGCGKQVPPGWYDTPTPPIPPPDLTDGERESFAAEAEGRRVIHDRPGDWAALMDVVRTAQDRSAAELEIDQVNAILRRHGIEHPAGAQGVLDLAGRVVDCEEE